MHAIRVGVAELATGDRAWAIPVAVLARLTFWAVTQRVWEDALITVAHARNAVEGLGLTHHAAEPLTHGFTSAISVLIPLAGEAVAPGSGITALRIVSLLAAVVAIVAADRLLGALDVAAWPRRFALLYLALDPLQVFYGMAGMETQVAVAVLLWSAWLTTQNRPIHLGISLGLGMLARPEFVLWAAIVAVGLLARHRRAAARAILAAGAVVAPWLAFTTFYYGSPIPQTIVAKALVYTPPITGPMWDWVLRQATAHVELLVRTYAPFFENSYVIAAPIPWGLSAAISCGLWLLVIAGALAMRRIAPSVGLAVAAFTLFRALLLPVYYFDWYTPPIAALGVVLAASGMSTLRWAMARRVVASVAAIAAAIPLLFVMGVERRVQLEVEDAVRTPAGQYLAAVVPPGEPVALEAAGYLGYYSRATIYDFPGLTSPAALAAVRSLDRQHRSVGAMMVVLRAPWIVVRPREFADLQALDPALAAGYELCTVFDRHLGSRIDWGGLVLATIDERFEVRRLGSCRLNP
jgi:hypothetical protein